LIDLEAGRFNFPYDRPDTNDGLEVMTAEMLEMARTNDARPPGKRSALDFCSLPPDFFIGCLDSDVAYVKVSILMVKRGNPFRFASLFMPMPEDYAVAGQVIEIKGERQPIGIVLNGNNSLLAGDGRGIGLLRAQAFISVLPAAEISSGFQLRSRPKDSFLVLCREQGSQFFHPAWVALHSANFYP
jgi:hypothetical protein